LIAQKDSGTISTLLQGQFTALADTAASGWGSVDAIGEIISNRPEQFGGYLSQLYQFTMNRDLLSDILRALGTIGEKNPQLIRKKAFYFIPLLQDHDPEIRGYTARLLGNLGTYEAKEDLTKVMSDSEEMEVYIDGQIRKWTIGQLATEALNKLSISQ